MSFYKAVIEEGTYDPETEIYDEFARCGHLHATEEEAEACGVQKFGPGSFELHDQDGRRLEV